MELAHAADYHFFGLFVHADSEGRVFSFELGKGLFQFGCALGFGGFKGEGHDGVGHEHALTAHWEAVVGLGQGVSSGALDSKYCKDIPSLDLLRFLHIIGMHFNDS